MTYRLPRIVITAGEPAGIGLDICVKLAHCALPAQITLLADRETLASRALQMGIAITLHTAHPDQPSHRGNGELYIDHFANIAPVTAGHLDPNNSPVVLSMLDHALAGCQSGRFDAMVTAPVHKGVINDAGIAFSGHTEYLAERCNVPTVVMMLVGGGMRVALVTTHLPLMQVSPAITRAHLTQVIRILHQDLKTKFGIHNPRIVVAGLNPHAGEGGYLGREEIETIDPVLEQLRQQGMQLVGALPADTMFSTKNMAETHAFLAMYHDQGLPVLKHASFGEGVNVTLGLPIIRTSVDHGTALEIAGSGTAEVGSLLHAIELAIEMTQKTTTP